MPLTRFLDENRIIVIPSTAAIGALRPTCSFATARGRHAAALGFGDCMTYAIARLTDELLIFVGEGFEQTDLVSALG